MIVSENIVSVDKISRFSNLLLSGNSIVSVTITLLNGAAFSLSTAGSDKIACVAQAYTSVAPFSFSAYAALQIVPAVSIISSISMAFFPATSPIMFITSDTLAFALLLSIIASGA